MNSLNILFVLFIVVGLANSQCTRDTYTSLPGAPVFPTANLSAADIPRPSTFNPLIQNHWSEVAKIGNYRPAKITPARNPAQTNCPHRATDLKDWHDASTWPNGVPANGASFSLPANTSVLISSCSYDPTWVFGLITVPANSKLIIGDAAIKLQATGINVLPGGAFLAGSPTCRLRNKIEITFYGRRPGTTPGGTVDPWRKGIAVTNGTIDVHGVQYFPTWTRLAMTATPGSSWIIIQDIVNWQPGQKIVVTTTEVKDARDWHRNEEAEIAEVRLAPTLGANVCAVRLVAPLAYTHFGGREYQAEVALLSRNIVIQGNAADSEPTDTNTICTRNSTTPNDQSTWPCEDSHLTGYGAHVIVQGFSSQGRFSGVEMFRAGQTNVLGRYPLHFHLIGDITESNYTRAYVQDSSVHRSYFRCFAIHGTHGVLFTQNTAYDAIGHCYFLEDGVEENNILSYNQAAHIHPLGPIVNPSNSVNGDGFGGQQLSWYLESDKLLLPSDMGAGCFYITNTFNDFFGNAASGGWAGFTIPSLRLPVKNHAHITSFVPANRPFRTPFRGNSAHSSGYWWRSAGSIYVGGELQQNEAGKLNYTLGRSRSRGTCANITAGAPGGLTYCPLPLWLTFEDNKVFLANRGLQNWGDRSEIIRFELHDVGLAMNVFGRVWIDQMLMECRQLSHRPVFMNGCAGAPSETSTSVGHRCNQRDTVFWTSFGGFQWYDVGQRHILTNTTFRNCENTWDRCIGNGRRGNCSNIAVFTSLTHSDQFVPEIMQTTNQIIYQNVSDLWRFTTKTTDRTGITVSGRLQSWIDVDGSAARLPGRSMIGSGWAGDWYKVNSGCEYYREAWRCKLAGNDGIASFKFRYDTTEEARIGSSICMNGGGANPCPVIGQLSHFGMKNESLGLSIAANPKVTGPVIGAAGGWFARFSKGTPKDLNINSLQLVQTTPLILALPYPAGTTFDIYYAASGGCNPSSTVCRHNYTAVNSVARVLSSFGDAYFWNSATKTLYLRIVQTGSNWGRKGSDPIVWNTTFVVTDTFSRAGLSLVNSAASSIWIKASCAGFYCDPQPDVAVPATITLPTPPTLPPTVTQPPTVNTGPPELSSSNDDDRDDLSSSESDGSDDETTTGGPDATTAASSATTGLPSQNNSAKTAISSLFLVASLLVVMFM